MAFRLATLALFAGSLVALAPSPAQACSIALCEQLFDLELSPTGPIPAGATALALRPVLAEEFGWFNPEKSPAAVTVTVTPAMGGAEVPGEVVAIDALDLLVWRPAAPLESDTEYEVMVTVDNSMLDYLDCGPVGFERMFAVTTGAALVVPLEVPEVAVSAELVSEPWLRPETMVCCDGAIPVDQSGGCGPTVGWFEGTCAAGSAFVSLTATATLDPLVVEGGMGQVGYHFSGRPFLHGMNEIELRSSEPFCGTLTAIHLMTGETMTGPEVCVGQELADMVGEISMDPTPGLAACVGEPYTCAVIPAPGFELWDGEDCMPWPEGQGSTGGETTDGPDDPTSGGGSSWGSGSASSGGESEGSSDGSSGTDSAGGLGGDGDKQGCACASGEGASPWALALLLAWPRRRRRLA